MNKITTAAALAAVLTLAAGCASSPDKMGAAYVSPMSYETWNCQQLRMEHDRLERRKAELHAQLKKKADTDSAQMAVGLLLLWPTLFFLEGGDGPDAVEYQRVKGECEAIEKMAVQKSCAI